MKLRSANLAWFAAGNLVGFLILFLLRLSLTPTSVPKLKQPAPRLSRRSPQPTRKQPPGPSPFPAPFPAEQLKTDLQTYLATRPGEWAVSLAREDDFALGLRSRHLFPAASVAKLVTALTVVSAVENGHLSESATVSGRPVTSWLQALINRSDNNAWRILRKKVGFNKEQELVRRLGLRETDLTLNKISAHDANRLLRFIWTRKSGRLSAGEPQKLDLLPLMRNTETEQRIAQSVREFFQNHHHTAPPIYHKAGTWPPSGTYNDAAVIPLADETIFLSILSEGKQTRAQAEETIRAITKRVLQSIRPANLSP
jgi:beta-lactamase class A